MVSLVSEWMVVVEYPLVEHLLRFIYAADTHGICSFVCWVELTVGKLFQSLVIQPLTLLAK